MKNILSIVLAVYNAEKQVGRLIESILAQTFSDYEFIIVNDGSTDNTPAICEYYSNKDDRILVIHQNNQGSVKARENGLSVAKGIYISFVDGDDWLDDDFYERMLDDCNEADVIVSGYIMEKENKSVECEQNVPDGYYEGLELQKLFEILLYNGSFYKQGIYPALWNKLIKRKLLLELGLNVPECVRMGEDSCFSYPAMFNASSIYVRNDIKSYHYLEQKGSMSKTYDKEYFFRIEQVYKWLDNAFETVKVGNIKEQLSTYVFFLIRAGIYQELYRGNVLNVLDNLKLLREHIKQEWMSEAIAMVDVNHLENNDLYLYRAVNRKSIIGWGLIQYANKLKERIILRIGNNEKL